MKRFFSFLLIFALVFSFSVPVFAADVQSYRDISWSKASAIFADKGYFDMSSSYYQAYNANYDVYYDGYIIDREFENTNVSGNYNFVYYCGYYLYRVNSDYVWSSDDIDYLYFGSNGYQSWSLDGFYVDCTYDGTTWTTTYSAWGIGSARKVYRDNIVASSFDIKLDDGSFFFKVPVPPLLEQVTTIQAQGGQTIQADLTDYLTTLVPYGICLMALLVGLVVLLRVLRIFLV